MTSSKPKHSMRLGGHGSLYFKCFLSRPNHCMREEVVSGSASLPLTR
ncbi:Uncharacterized protein ToN1_49830 [Aromatoleum petrolei]|nr:Uncharacterized protein ToN1_49830 [Aromatoleum petrolei]